jgi:hypothetical protein
LNEKSTNSSNLNKVIDKFNYIRKKQKEEIKRKERKFLKLKLKLLMRLLKVKINQ